MRATSFLVVDDSRTVRNLVADIIKNDLGGEVVHKAADGAEALAVLKEHEVDVVISDWNMPNMSGEELLYAVRQELKRDDLPFIMMTANDDRDSIITAVQLGASQYIIKPFTPMELEEKIISSWNYFNKRADKRYASLPQHKARIVVAEKSFQVQLQDISRTGALVKLRHAPEINLFKVCEVNLEFQDFMLHKVKDIGPLPGMIVRLETEDSFHPKSKNCLAGLYFNPQYISEDVREKLKKLLKWLHSRNPEIVKDI